MEIHGQDIETLTSLVLTRFSSDAAETTRVAELRNLLSAAADLTRALQIQTHYVMVDHRGTHGTNDLRAAGRELFRALDAYARALHQLVERYPDLAAPDRSKDHLISSTPPAGGSLRLNQNGRTHGNETS